MRYVPVNCIKKGMICGKPLMGMHGELLLSRGSVIYESYINKIKEMGFKGVYIDDDLSRNINIEEILDESIRFEAVSKIKSVFERMADGTRIKPENIKSLNNLVNDIIENILKNMSGNRDIMVNMMDLKSFDDYTFYHSVNVAVLSIFIGISAKLGRDQLNNLGLTAILHDIGKVFIPREILNKPGKLNSEEFEVIMTHPYEGYIFLKENTGIPAPVYVGILQHHERFDGTGYPGRYKGNQISLFGRIITIADVYDALTSDRPYRKSLSPSDSMEYIMGNCNTLFDPEMITIFTQKIAPYPVGTCVTLSNNKTGLVIKNHSDCCLRPKIKVIRHGNEEVEPYIIDLKNFIDARDITIVGIADI